MSGKPLGPQGGAIEPLVDVPLEGGGGLKLDIHLRFTPPDKLRVETGYVKW